MKTGKPDITKKTGKPVTKKTTVEKKTAPAAVKVKKMVKKVSSSSGEKKQETKTKAGPKLTKLKRGPGATKAGVKGKAFTEKKTSGETKLKKATKKPEKKPMPLKVERTRKTAALKEVKKKEVSKTKKAPAEKKSNPARRPLKAAPKIKGAGKEKKASPKPAEKKAIFKKYVPIGEKGKKLLREIQNTELPEEYGENELFLIPVEPGVVYASWEIRKDELSGVKDELHMHVYDATGGEAFRKGGRIVDIGVDIRIDKRVGSGFFDIGVQGKDIFAEIGLLSRGRKFRSILKSSIVSVPGQIDFDKLGIAMELFQSGLLIGY